MERKHKQPKTLQEAVVFFADPNNALAYMTLLRWPDGIVVCPSCGRNDVVFLHNQRKWQCKSVHAKRQFSAKVGTIFEDSPIPLEKWLVVVWMISNCRNGVSSYEIARTIGVTQKSAWFMLHRIRLAMQEGGGLLGGGPNSEVEADETFIGGKARNMHKRVKARRIHAKQGNSAVDKVLVMGMLERGGKIRTEILKNRFTETLRENLNKHVAVGTALYTDEFNAYKGVKDEYLHAFCDHTDQYVKGRVHTNGIENFWSLLKRGLSGTYVAVEPFHMFRYLDEQCFRYNNRKDGKRKLTDKERFDLALAGVTGKRLTYVEVTGKTRESQTSTEPF
jgi:transposase-like protein